MHIFPLTTYSCIHTRGSRSKTLSKTAAHLSLCVEEEEMSKQVDGQGLVLSADAKPRLKWTRQLHERFTDAVAKLGGADKATPKSVMRLMGIPGLTLFHLKSHLQKYRLAKNRDYNAAHENKKQDCSAVYYSSAESRAAPTEGHDKLQQPQFNEAMFKIQMDVQRKLQEQIEVQRHLQLRIEAQGKYLQTVLRKAQETLVAYSSNSAEAEAAKAELSELVSAVDNTESLSSSLSQDSLVPKRARNADCNSDSCLTSSAKPEVADRKRRWRSDDPSEEDSDDGANIDTEMEHNEELDLNK